MNSSCVKVKQLKWDNRNVPQKATYAATGDYQVSKLVTRHLPKLNDNGDNIYDNVAVSRNVARRELYLTEQRLANKRKVELAQRKILDERWAELEKKEATLKQSFIEFNQYVKENDGKRKRTMSQILYQTQLRESYDKQTKALLDEYRELKEVKELMEGKIRENGIYEGFLNKVVEKSPELFKDTLDVLKRYDAIIYAKKVLSNRQERDLNTIQTVKRHLHKMVGRCHEKMETMHTRAAILNQRYEAAKKNCLKWEAVLQSVRYEAAEALLEADEVQTTCRHIYRQICRRMGVDPEYEEDDYQNQLECIKKALHALAFVNAKAKAMRKKEMMVSERTLVSGVTK